MTPEKAIQHFHFKLTKVWDATESDIKAFESIKNYVIENQKKTINENQLFAKLYVYLYGQFLNYYKATVFDNIPQKQLNQVLETPLEQIIENFRKQLNESELYQIQKNIGFSEKHSATRSESENLNDNELLKDVIDSGKVNETFFNEQWKYKDVEDNLVAQIGNALNNYK